MKKYTPPPKYKGQNFDRGYTDQDQKKEKPLSNQFPTTKKPRNYDNRLPYKED